MKELLELQKVVAYQEMRLELLQLAFVFLCECLACWFVINLLLDLAFSLNPQLNESIPAPLPTARGVGR